MEIDFYKEVREDIDISISVSLDDGKLRLDGYEYGSTVKRLQGTERDFEYSLLLDKENTDKLFDKLGISDKTNKQKLEAIRDRFSKDKGVFGLDKYCEANGIKTFYYSSF